MTVPKLQLLCVLPYTDKSSLDLRACLISTFEKNIPFCKLNVVFRATCRLGNLFIFKICSGIVYPYSNSKYSAIAERLLHCNSPIAFDDIDVLVANSKTFKLLIKKILLIKQDNPVLNRTINSFPRDLFD